MFRATISRLAAPFRATWRWLDPDFHADTEYLRVQSLPRFEWPDGVTPGARRKFVDMMIREVADQLAAVDRQAAKRDRLLTVALTAVGILFAAGAAFSLSRWLIAPAEVELMLIVAYLLWCQRSHDRPVGFTAQAFLKEMPATLTEDEADSWIMDSAEVAKAKVRAVSVAWGRHVNVASVGIAIAFGYLVIIALVAADSSTPPRS